MNESKRILRKVKKLDLLPSLIDKVRQNVRLSKEEAYQLWVGLNDLALTLACRHYKEKQYHINYDWLNPLDSEQMDKQHIRYDYVFQFIKEYKEGVPAKGVLFALHRRFPYLEMLVECKHYGIDVEPGKPIHRRVNSRIIKDLILACTIYRNLHRSNKRIPNYREVVVDYVTERIRKGQKISYSDVTRFVRNTIPFFIVKQVKYAVEFREEIYRESQYVDTI